MALAAGQYGFLAATPKTWERNRAQQLIYEKSKVETPDISWGKYLMALLFEAGPSEHGPQGELVGLKWTTLHAFNQCLEVPLLFWELKALKRMSVAYVRGHEQGKEPLAIPPMEIEGWLDGGEK